jgi:DNA polymerase III subunit gamma/tau
MPNDLAQRYRPKTLDEVVGQKSVIGLLEGMLTDDPLPPAVLLHGPTSAGKTTLSRIIPTYSNCKDTENFEPCWECKSCKAALKMIDGVKAHPDVEVINCAGDRGIDMTRSLRERAKFLPRYRYRWFILDECHRLTPDAQENLLTLLEEPPKKTRFILLTTNPEKLKSPLKNRCQVFKLGTVDVETLTKLLRKITKAEKRLLPKKVCKQIAEVSEGVPREALKITEQVLNNLASGKKIDPKEAALVVKEITKYAAPAVTRAYMEGIFAANYTLAFSALDHIDSHEFLVTRAIETVQAVLYEWVDPDGKQLGGTNPHLLKGIDVPNTEVGRKLLRLGHVQKLLDTFLDTQERIKGYLVDSRALMQSATMEAIRNVTKWSQYTGKSKKTKTRKTKKAAR